MKKFSLPQEIMQQCTFWLCNFEAIHVIVSKIRKLNPFISLEKTIGLLSIEPMELLNEIDGQVTKQMPNENFEKNIISMAIFNEINWQFTEQKAN